MHYLDDTLVFSPSDLMLFMASPFASWMERLTLEHPDHGIESDRRDLLLQALANRGIQHERAYLDQLHAQGLDMAVTTPILRPPRPPRETRCRLVRT